MRELVKSPWCVVREDRPRNSQGPVQAETQRPVPQLLRVSDGGDQQTWVPARGPLGRARTHRPKPMEQP